MKRVRYVEGVVAVITNWNTSKIAVHSLRRIRREVPTIFVDNGSNDGLHMMAYFQKHDPYCKVMLDRNMGSSIARNSGIQKALKKYRPKYIFLLDGDILYVPHTIRRYREVLEGDENIACIGQNKVSDLLSQGYNGTRDPASADIAITEGDLKLSNDFPMAWTQYGLFRADFLEEHPFVTITPFDLPGHGYEDDWMYQEIKRAGFQSVASEHPRYYHDAHSSMFEMRKRRMPTKTESRKRVFERYWPDAKHWTEVISV